MSVRRNGELMTFGNVPIIQEFNLKHDSSGVTFDNGPYFVMERYDRLFTDLKLYERTACCF